MTTKYCMGDGITSWREVPLFLKIIQLIFRNIRNWLFRDETRRADSESIAQQLRDFGSGPLDHPGMTCLRVHFAVLPSRCPAPTGFRLDRPAARARRRSIWPLGKVTQISPIHSSLTLVIGLALKLVRLTTWPVLPRSIVFR